MYTYPCISLYQECKHIIILLCVCSYTVCVATNLCGWLVHISSSPLQCLSHIEDRLLELNEKGMVIANSAQEHGPDADLREVLQRALNGLK